MLRIGKAMQEADGNSFHLCFIKRRQQFPHALLIQRNEDLAVCRQALPHRQPQATWHERLGLFYMEVIMVVPAFVAHFQGIAKSLCRQERNACAAALDDGVGRQGRAVHEGLDVSRLKARCRQYLAGTFHNRNFGCVGRCQYLLEVVTQGTIVKNFECEIGERAANVDTEPCHFLKYSSP
ncbi:hypothetical protein CO2235_MP10323 [Cupriavidus oxalaticus]|uniref:Uncharacterized protein n=1 Tax=Cupriavidus oxalaticus TaxID=96344 RepID=A0A375GCY3_9BURK|nr:hypothetical protein CO2235_U1010110 [Cupriavidus oxalaticus]SPC18079.1 hypothetical protein CO2235_MP10323 [Cupriavidus oxalaticus]